MSTQQALAQPISDGRARSGQYSRRFSRYWFVSRTLMLLWLLLSLWQIGGVPLGEGEALTVLLGFRLASGVEDPVALGLPFMHGIPPLSYLPSALGAHLLPISEFTMRLPFALIGAVQMPLLFALVSRTFGRRAAALAGLMLLGTGIFAINRLALGTSMFITLELGGALLLLRYVESGDRRWLWFSAGLLGAASLVYLDGVLLLVAALGIAWWSHGRRADVGVAAALGAGTVLAVTVAQAIVGHLYRTSLGVSADLPSSDGIGRLVSSAGGLRFAPGSFIDSWIVYLGVPVLLLVLVGLVEAAIHSKGHRRSLLVLTALAAIHLVSVLLVGPRPEQAVLTAPLVIAVAGFGWAQLLGQLRSVATQGTVAMAVAAVAFAGIAWNQAVFNPQTEFTEELGSLRDYALSLEHGAGLSEDDTSGFKAMAQVLRDETGANDTVLVTEGVSAAAVSLYSARRAEPLDLLQLAADDDGAEDVFLVIKGEDETFSAGLSGTMTVVANHRVFRDGQVLYQLLHLSSSGESFQAPIWWRADAAEARFVSQHTTYTGYLPPIERGGAGG